jgi:hypothetical protein
MIYKKTEYVQEDENDQRFPIKRIEVLEPVGNEDETSKFIGHVILGMQTPMGVHQFPVSFEIEAEDVQSAFNRFEAHANPQIEQARRQIQEEVQKVQQQRKSKIIQPGDVNMQNRGNVIDFNKLKTD